MMASFDVGQRIQAVDQNGHWVGGQVVEVCDEGKVVVAFTGWPGYDRVVGPQEIRTPLLPVEQQMRSKWAILLSSRCLNPSI